MIAAKIKDIISQSSGGRVLSLDLSEKTDLISDVGLESVELLQVTMGIEEEFRISMDLHELDSELFKSVSSLVMYVERKVSEAGRSTGTI